MKIKFGVDDLQVGMFVSELDRPWLETPFELEGLLIEGPEEIEQIQKISPMSMSIRINRPILPGKPQMRI